MLQCQNLHCGSNTRAGRRQLFYVEVQQEFRYIMLKINTVWRVFEVRKKC